jgi:hypothetical protein
MPMLVKFYQSHPENPEILKIMIQTNFTNIGMEKCERD